MTDIAVQRNGTELIVRIVAATAMATVALVAVVLGGSAFWALVSAGALAMVGEWAGLVDNRPYRGVAALGAMAVVLILASPALGVADETVWIGLAACAAAILVLARAPAVAAGVVYIGLPALSMLYLRDQSDGTELTVWTITVVCVTDIGAFFVGRAVGGRKLAPRISPGKTWAGLFGGMAAALFVGLALAVVLHLPPRLGALGALLAVAAQGGDLLESWLKRRAGVKDSGRLLPGHGGAFDRLDGLVPVACIVAMLIVIGWI